MTISRTVRALAIVPVLGALALGPGVAFAEQSESKVGRHNDERHERMLESSRGHIATTTKDGIRGLFEGNGLRHNGILKHKEAFAWNTAINATIKNGTYSQFMNLASNTPLGTSTTESIWNKLVDASNKHDEGKYLEASNILKSLRDSGYHFKKLVHESLKMLFTKK